MKIIRQKQFGNPAYKTPNLNLNINRYKYIRVYKDGPEKDDLNDIVQNDWEGGKDNWLKNYICVAGVAESYHDDLYYNKKDKRWYTFDGDYVGGNDEKDVVQLVKSPKDWADYMENLERSYFGEEPLKTTAKAPTPLVKKKPKSLPPSSTKKDRYAEYNGSWEWLRGEPKNFWQAWNKGGIEKGDYVGDKFKPAGPIKSFKYALDWKKNKKGERK